MHSTTAINAVINKAKQDRADFIATTVQGGVLPVALAAIVSLALAYGTIGSSEEQAQQNPVVQVSAQNG